MTKTTLRLDHLLTSENVEQADKGVKVSIRYAIATLEDVRDELVNKFMTKSAKTIQDKIEELKSLIK